MRVNSATVEEHLKMNLKELELNHWFKNERKTQHWIIDSKTKGKPNILTWIGASEAEMGRIVKILFPKLKIQDSQSNGVITTEKSTHLNEEN